MKILLVTDIDFWTADRGDRKRISQLFSYLSGTGLDVYLFLTGKTPGGAYHSHEKVKALHDQYGFKMVHVFEPGQNPSQHLTARKGGLLEIFKNLIDRFLNRNIGEYKEPELCNFADPELKTAFTIFFNEVEPDFLLVEYIRLAYLAAGLHHRAKTIIDTHDVMHLRYEAFKHAGQPHWLKISREEEITTLNKFDAILAIQGKERDYFRRNLNNKCHVLKVELDMAIESISEPNEEKISIGFIGADGHANHEGLLHFLEKVWPRLVDASQQQVNLNIAGSICDRISQTPLPPGVTLLGRVEQTTDFYRRTSIVVNPVYFGGGLKIKTVEALAHGKPLVTTPTGCEGLEEAAGDSFWVAADEDDFLIKLLKLTESEDTRRQLSAKALSYAISRFSPDAVYKELSNYLGLN